MVKKENNGGFFCREPPNSYDEANFFRGTGLPSQGMLYWN